MQARNDRDAIIEAVGDDPNGVTTDEVCRRLGKSPQVLGDTFERLLADGSLLGFAGLWIAPKPFEEGFRRFSEALQAMHQEKPALAAQPREAVVHRAGLNWAGKPLDRILAHLASDHRIAVSGTTVRSAEFLIRLSPRQRELLDRVMIELEKEPINVAYVQDIARAVPIPIQAAEEILKLGIQAGDIVSLAEGVFYTRRQLDALKIRIAEIAGKKPFAASTMRDALGTSRKYIIPLLEYFDSIRFTTRIGDDRIVN